ncbi:surface lipoprotein assembly modifier [Vibrio sp. SCSIO 43137]|uniref:surface lipoprotein assembly modifier n=1 Tax=Vibrio sp. SCSIO 43137 TaxID=3021011 RepID=UPI002306EE0C|nr:DUF2860 family protein [Vibrio sp. SCSIO 43137]WCE32489.1 DUF2860 family protein [Vibrio sp. SCSIO 43137]
MKHLYPLCLVPLLLSGTATAETSKKGISGEIGFIAGYSRNTSNFNLDNETKSGSLNSKGKTEGEAVFGPLGQVRYNMGDKEIFLGTSQEDIVKGIFAVELGYKQEISRNGSLSFSYLPTVVEGETWRDPYVVNSKREKTDISGNAYRLKYEFLSLTADVIYYDYDIDKEESGTSQNVNRSLLKRSGDGYIAHVGVGLPITSSTIIEPALYYRKNSADGKAMAYDQTGVGITFIQMFGDNTLAIDTRYSKSEHKAVNPVFNKKQKDSDTSITISFEKSQFMGWSAVNLNAALSYSKSDSNIAFYDESEIAAFTGMNYQF